MDTIQQVMTCGVSFDDARKLRRISMTLRRWFEHECNGAIQRDDDGRPYWHSTVDGRKIAPAPDRERGALKRLSTIMIAYPTLTTYVQGDPRGCPLHILRPGDVPDGKDVDAYYSRGVAVY